MSAPFRIGIDARAFKSPAGGMRRYVWEIYSRLPRLEPGVEVIAVGAADEDALPADLVRRPATPFPTNLGWTAVSLPLAIRGAGLDVFHAPAYTAPLWGVHPQVLTIHDVSYERVPEWNAYKNDPARRWFYRRSALAADAVITDSQFSKDEIVAAYGIAPAAIRVIPLAAAATFAPGPFDPAAVPAGVRQPYLLHVGDLQVRRNLTTALAATLKVRANLAQAFSHPADVAQASRPAADVAQAFRPASPVLVCAGVDRGIGGDLIAQARAAGDPDALVLTGPVSDAALLNLYRGAAMLVYPSRYEGFGLPILEAMQCGIPVVAANTSSLPELVGDAGPLLPALDVDAWSTAIRAILSNPSEAARLRGTSLARATLFSWDRTARETLAALRACVIR